MDKTGFIYSRSALHILAQCNVFQNMQHKKNSKLMYTYLPLSVSILTRYVNEKGIIRLLCLQ